MPTRHFDAAALSADMFNSRPALRTVLETLLPWLVEARSQLADAITRGEAEAFGHVLHRMRGALAQLRAADAVSHIKVLEEQSAHDGGPTIPSDHPALAALDAELDALASEVAAYLATLRDDAEQKTSYPPIERL